MIGDLSNEYCAIQTTGGLCAAQPDPPMTAVPDMTSWANLAEETSELETYFASDIVMLANEWQANAGFQGSGDWLTIPGLNIPTAFTSGAFDSGVQGSWFFYFRNMSYKDTTDQYPSAAHIDPAYQDVTDYFQLAKSGPTFSYSAQAENNMVWKESSCATTSAFHCLNNYRLCHGTSFPTDLTLFYVDKMLTEMVAQQSTVNTGVYLDVFYAASYPCFEPGHGHTDIGGGTYWTEGKIALTEAIKDFAMDPNGYDLPDYSIAMESPVEYFLGTTDLAFVNFPQSQNILPELCSSPCVTPPTPGQGCSSTTHVWLAPLFDAVYHEYYRLFYKTGLVDDVALNTVPEFAFITRRAFAAQVFLGRAPFLGVKLYPTLGETFDDHKSNPQDGLAVNAAMIQDYMEILTLAAVRDFQVFGERLRDPVVTGLTCVNAVQSKGLQFLSPYGEKQPPVYVAAHRDTGDGRIGLALANWTHEDDASFFDASFWDQVVPGAQSLTLVIDADDYGLTHALHRVVEVTPTGQVTVPGGIDLSSGTGTLAVTVPPRSLRFFIIKA